MLRSGGMVDAESEIGGEDARAELAVDARTIGVWRWGMVFGFLPPLVGVSIAAGVVTFFFSAIPLPLWVVWLAVAGLILLAALVVWLYPPASYRHLRYRIDDSGITIRQGVFWRTQSYLPQVRIQHSDVSQGPLQRRYGVATLKLYTAGSQYTCTTLPGLEHEDAVALRDRLQRSGRGDVL